MPSEHDVRAHPRGAAAISLVQDARTANIIRVDADQAVLLAWMIAEAFPAPPATGGGREQALAEWAAIALDRLESDYGEPPSEANEGYTVPEALITTGRRLLAQAPCERCRGKGVVADIQCDPSVYPDHIRPCEVCQPCGTCGGRGRVFGYFDPAIERTQAKPCPDCAPTTEEGSDE